MAKTREVKKVLLAEYKELLTKNQGYIAVDAHNIAADKVLELKMKLKAIDSNITVVKNNIFKIALDETDQPIQAKDFASQTAVIFYETDPTTIAKLLKEVQKETEVLEARYGMINGEFIDSSKIMQLAEIPSREELLAKMLGSMVSPISGFMNATTGNVRGFVQIIKQLSEKDEAATAE